MAEKYTGLICGDSDVLLQNMLDSGIKVDLVLTDPPYNLGLFMHKRNTNLKKMRENQFAYAGWDNLEYKDWKRSMSKFLSQCQRVLKKRGTLIIFMAVIKVSDIIELAEKAGFYYKTTGVWHKTNPMPRNMNLQFVNSTECWLYFINPTQKPLSILRELIESVTNSDDMVLDPFMGSGSTCVAAAELGRRYYGIELDEKYHKIAEQRMKEINAK